MILLARLDTTVATLSFDAAISFFFFAALARHKVVAEGDDWCALVNGSTWASAKLM
jgi:hypothetical protein